MSGFEGIVDRIVRAIRLDPDLYRDVADDEVYTSEAILIVIGVAFFAALGAAFTAEGPLTAFVGELINGVLFGWLLWSVLAYLVGDLFGGRSSVGEMARTLGYATAPRILALFGFIPVIGWIFSLAAWGLSIFAGVIAIRESMEFNTLRALITAGVGLLLYILVRVLIGVFL